MALVFDGKVLALSGGVGGAKLALGLAKLLEPEQLSIIANTADDFQHLGLHISPDIDTVMYTLSGLANQQQGWGLEAETFQAMTQLQCYGGETWFRLGDKDLATHLQRTLWLSQGSTLSEVTRRLCHSLGISTAIIPMSDDPVQTRVSTEQGELAFQHYFVREQCRPAVTGFHFNGIDQASISDGFARALADPALRVVIICPSNPFVSVAPILALKGVRDIIRERGLPVIAVSPIVNGLAIKGPAAKMMAELSMPVSAAAVADYYVKQYEGLLTGFVLDNSDEGSASSVSGLELAVNVSNTIMKTLDDRMALAKTVLDFASELRWG